MTELCRQDDFYGTLCELCYRKVFVRPPSRLFVYLGVKTAKDVVNI